MAELPFEAVDRYLTDLYIPSADALAAALAVNHAAKLPSIDVSPTQGKFLQLLARSHGARRVLEIGTLGGYSTLWLAGALPADGYLLTLEFNPRHAEVAGRNFERAGLGARIELRLGRALDSLAKLETEGQQPFDFFVIDADKTNNPNYLDWALKLSRPGSLLVFDNVIREGEILDAHSSEAAVQGTRRLHERLATERRVSSTVIQTVGSKGYDGFAIALVVG